MRAAHKNPMASEDKSSIDYERAYLQLKESENKLKIHNFTTKDLVYISVTVTMVYAVGVITKLTVGAVPVPGMKTITGAFFSTLVISIGLMLVKKVGTLTFIQLIYGIISGFVFPGLPFLSLIVVGGIAGDLTTKLLKGSYEDKKYVISACSICYFIIALVLFYVMILIGYPGAIFLHEVIFCIAIVCLLLGMLGSYVGTGIVGRLKKVGLV